MWKFDSVMFCKMVYHKSKVGQVLMYMQHMHMECGKFHTCHDLVLDQNINDNAYSTPLLHEALGVYHKMVIMGIGFYHNTFSHIFVQHQHYPEYDILCLSIFLQALFIYFTWSMTPCFRCSLERYFWNYLDILTSLFCVKECIIICESNSSDPGSWTLAINWYI